MNKDNNMHECFIAKLDDYIYLIPSELKDLFETTYFFERQEKFKEFLLPDEIIFDCLVEQTDLDYFMDGGWDC